MKRLMVVYSIFILCILLQVSVAADNYGNDIRWTHMPTEMTIDDYVLGNTTRGIDVSIYRSAYHAPDSTPMLTKGVVSDGVITEIRVGVLVTNNGVVYANKNMTWGTTAVSSKARFISGDAKTNANGQAFAYFHVRSLSALPVRVSCGDVTKSASIAVPANQLYKSPKTASGTTPTVGKTIAVDPYYIPMVNRNGWKRGLVNITTTGSRRAEDTGGAIKDFHTDVYVGVGMANVTENNHYSPVMLKGIDAAAAFAKRSQDVDNGYNDTDALPMDEKTNRAWYTNNGKLCAYESDRNYSAAESKLEVTVSGEAGNKRVLVRLPISEFALDIADVTFIDDTRVGIESHINPSTNVYEIFDLNSGDVLETYYGYGFVHFDDTVYYVQAPPHFSGIRGHNRIISSDGVLIYESKEGIMINDSLEIRDNQIVFTENSFENGRQRMRSVEIVEDVLRTDVEDILYY